MPYYMDRHDLDGATAADIAAAHLRDLSVQQRHGVEFLTYWFDYERQHTFCYARAPSREAVTAAHGEAHGQLPGQIIDVDEAELSRFMGGIGQHPPGDAYVDSAFRAIMFTDLEGSTDLTQRLGDAGAMAIQRGLAAAERRSEMPAGVRIGIAAGEPVAEGNDLFGTAVQLAARLCARASPRSILVSSAVRDLAQGKGFTFGASSRARLKGFAEQVRVHEVAWQPEP